MAIFVQDAVNAVQEVLRNKGHRTDHVTADTPLSGLELDSLDLAEILIVLEDKAGGELNPNDVKQFERVADLAHLPLRVEL